MPRPLLSLFTSLLLVASGAVLAPVTSWAGTATADEASSSMTRSEVARASSAGRTRFGVSVATQSGQDYVTARRQAESRYGRVGVLRYFDPNRPNPWKRIRAHTGRRPLVISFKLDPARVIAGTHDRYMRSWFAKAPTRRPTWWSFNPEPEDRVEAREYTARQYRAAWRRLAGLADEARNPRLRSSLALMCWTVHPGSGRNWRDYYAGRRHVDVLAWDCYNWASDGYTSPKKMFGKAVRLSRRVGKPWAVAETGSALIRGDRGRQRAAWLRRLHRYTARKQAVFVTYFDARGPQQDNRLRDAPSKNAWRKAVSRSG